MKHPNILYTADGEQPPFKHGGNEHARDWRSITLHEDGEYELRSQSILGWSAILLLPKDKKIIKTLSKQTRLGTSNRPKSSMDASVRKKVGIEQAKKAIHQAALARRNIQRIQVMTRFNLRIIRIVVKAAAVAVKGIMALLGVSGSVIMLMCIVLAVASLIAHPLWHFLF